MPFRLFSQQKHAPVTTGKILYQDAALEKLLPRSTTIEIIGSGFQHIEGPVWVTDSNMLLFSDTKAQIIYRWSEEKGLSKFLSNTGFTGRLPYSEEPGTNGLALDGKGNLLICEHGDRRIAAYPLSGKYGKKTIADAYNEKRFNSPNDLVALPDGSIWFTDPAHGLPNKDQDVSKEISFSGVYNITSKNDIKLAIKDLPHPNGLAFSSDKRLLYVSNSSIDHSFINVYPVSADGVIGQGNLFFDGKNLEKEQGKEVMDGLKTDKYGNVWATGPGGLSIISASGKLLGTIKTGEVMSNCTWGNDGSTLYITAGCYLYRIKATVKENF